MRDDILSARNAIEESVRSAILDSAKKAHPFLVQLHSIQLIEKERLNAKNSGTILDSRYILMLITVSNEFKAFSNPLL